LLVDQKNCWRDFCWWLIWFGLVGWCLRHERVVRRLEDLANPLEVIERILVDLIAEFTWQMQEWKDLSHPLHLSASDPAKS
jgi:hypothetical protein